MVRVTSDFVREVIRQNRTWTCNACAEEVPGNFDVCWNCCTEREHAQEPLDMDEPTDPFYFDGQEGIGDLLFEFKGC